MGSYKKNGQFSKESIFYKNTSSHHWSYLCLSMRSINAVIYGLIKSNIKIKESINLKLSLFVQEVLKNKLN